MVSLAFVALGCRDIQRPIITLPETGVEQSYLFDTYYVNFSWGYTLNGTYIDQQGNVITYDHSFEQWSAANFDSLTRAELDEKYVAPTDTIAHIDPLTLREMFEKIEPASGGELSERIFMGPDAGGRASVCYKYDEDTERYIRVLLSLTGSYRQTNLSEAAMELQTWLEEVLSSAKAHEQVPRR